ncbi:unnamed protein product [Vitrella brassicaformis CCMP3155]|uniref:AP2/ERF domain-containing protein n=1 Tax=Vitrella brassicaformis (strain CCMP3155) TaxID=1169540 RepID=A0A0G4GHS3_VITBC|nr:unnamed protein product [Vitrella brassicaformis CCMP3155]|eukprot:CEM29285.1 unnamed protein product [Vitrella brassicaformis CCMP3155]
MMGHYGHSSPLTPGCHPLSVSATRVGVSGPVGVGHPASHIPLRPPSLPALCYPAGVPGYGVAPQYPSMPLTAATAHRRAMDVVVSPWPSPGGGIAAYRPIAIGSRPATVPTGPLSEHQSGVTGVSFHKVNNAWQANWQESGIHKGKSFSVRRHGFEGAKMAAIAHRREMERLHYYYDEQRGSLMAIPPAERHRQGAVDDHSGPQEETDTTDGGTGPHETRAGGQPAATSAADIEGARRVEEDIMLTKLLEGVRATDPHSGGLYEIATLTVAGQQTRAIRWRPTDVCVASDRRDVQDQGLADPPKRHLPSSPPVNPCNGRDPSLDGSRSPKRQRTELPQNDSHHKGRPMCETNKTVVTKRVPEHTSDVPGACWQALSRSWAASWYEKGDKRRKHKFFSASKHGFDKAKALAEQHRRTMELTGRAVVRRRFDPEHQSGVKGVSFNKCNNLWQASWRESGIEKKKAFSVRRHGYEGAKKAAIAHRREMERQHYTFRNKGEAGLCSPRDDQATSPSRNALAESSTASPADLSFPLYPELMAKAVMAPQTTAPLPTASTTQTAAASPLSDRFGLGHRLTGVATERGKSNRRERGRGDTSVRQTEAARINF